MKSNGLRRLFRIAGVLATLALVAGALGIGYVAWRHVRPVTLPNPTGPFAVGRMEFDWTDRSRPDPLNPTDTSGRELDVWVWYPAEPVAGAEPAPYLPAPWGDLLDKQHGAAQVFFQRLDSIHAHALTGAPVAAAQSKCPVLVFLPGFGSIPANYAALVEDLASHGYVVAGVTPTDSAPVVVFPDGRVAERTELGNVPDDADLVTLQRRAADVIAVWSADARFTVDRLAALNAELGNPFAGRLDLSRVGILGHSFGGATAAEACRQDTRFRAGADLDGTLFGPVAQTGLTQPFLFVESDENGPCDAVCRADQVARQRVFEGLTEGYDLTIAGARHFNFSDNAVLFEPILKLMGLLGPIDGHRGLEIAAAYVRAFFDHELGGGQAPLLIGPSPAYPEVNLRIR